MRPAIFKTLTSRIILLTVCIVIFSLLSTAVLIKKQAEKAILKNLENNALNLLETVRVNIETEYKNVQEHNHFSLNRRKTEMKNYVEILFKTINLCYEKVISNEFTEEEARHTIFGFLETVKYDQEIGYFWIHTNELPYSRMVYHPIMPELNGKILRDSVFNSAKNSNQNLFSTMTALCRETGEGYVEYKWPKPKSESLSVYQPKISYVKIFKPWNWILGSGVYIDDLELETNNSIKEIVNHLNNTLSNRFVSENGYCFIFGEDNFMYVHPYLANRSGDELINPTTSNKILNDIKATYQSGKNHMDFNWNRIDDRENYIYPKRVYIGKFEPLNWYICVSVYKYDFEKEITKLTQVIFFLTLAFLILSVILAIIISKSITHPLNELVNNLENVDREGLPIKISIDSKTREIKTLTQTINNMIDSIQKSRQDIRSERDFSMGLITGSPNVIIGFQHNGTISFINPEGEKLLEYHKNEILGVNFWDLLIVENEGQRQKLIQKITRSNSRNLEIKIETETGRQLFLLWNSIDYNPEEKEFTEIFGICINITDRKKAENKLEFYKAYLTDMIDSMPSVIIGVDKSGIIRQLNQKAKEFLQIKFIQYTDNLLSDLMPQLDISPEILLKTIKMKKPFVKSLKNVEMKNGHRYLDITIFPLHTGSFEEAVIRIDDVTEKTQMEEMMVQSEKMLSIGGLAAGMAHEINNPIAGMLQNAIVLQNKLSENSNKSLEVARELGLDIDLLLQFLERRDIKKHLELIHNSGTKAAEIISNMLSFARKSESRFKYIQVPNLIQSTIDILASDYDLKKKYDFKKISITQKHPENLPLLKCEETKIQQVIMNIFRNGAEAMSEYTIDGKKPEFLIQSSFDDENITIRIENNGPSIPENIRTRIFDPFFTTKNVGEGTGIGLSVSYFIITKNHSGKMWIESEEGENTKFYISLPNYQINGK
ncbi:MAG: cache domain-containing protein [Candidatus Marinimicrobia bacterium]|nr:cache domain-containing protein [Candidatus Neomarinimicrobiota bacterium]